MHISGVSKKTNCNSLLFCSHKYGQPAEISNPNVLLSLPFIQSDWDPRNVGTLSI